MRSIVEDDDIRGGDPRIEGTRITVIDVKRRVIDGNEDPHVVAGEYDLSMAELFSALAYYYDHREELEADERTAATRRRDGERYTRSLFDRRDRSDEEAIEGAD